MFRATSLLRAIYTPLATFLLLTTVLLAQRKWDTIESDVVRGRVIVKLSVDLYSRGLSRESIAGRARLMGDVNIRPWLPPTLVSYRIPTYMKQLGSEDPAWGLRRIMVIEYSGPADPVVVAQRISAMEGVEYAEPERRRALTYRPNDPRATAQWYLEKIAAFDAWDVRRGDSSMVIAIVDAGIERDHPDLADALWRNPGENGLGRDTNGIDDDGNGFVDDSWGWDFAGSDGHTGDNVPDNRFEDHGTVSAGCAAAVGDNTIGIAGVAWGCRLMAVKVTTDAPSPPLFNEAAGILYAAKMGAKIINCSFGGTGKSRAEAEVVKVVIDTYGAVIVAACGNNGRDEKFYPASYNGVISVAATTETDAKSSYSNYNYRVDLSAPGDNILSTGSGDYVVDIGTSFATPQVSGAAALVRLQWPQASVAVVSEIVRATTDDIRVNLGMGYADKMGYGRLNVGRALVVGPAIRSARATSWMILEEVPDGTIQPGETIRLRPIITNMLAAAPLVRAVVEAVDPVDIVIQGSSVDLGSMLEGESRPTDDTAFILTVPAALPPNSTITVRLTTTTDDRSNDQVLAIPIAPTYRTTDNNDIAVTFNSVGNVGFNGIKRSEGDGLTYRGGEGILYHGGLIIGLDSVHIADVVRLGPTSLGVADGLRYSSVYRLSYTADSSVETGVATYGDAHLPVGQRVGVDVTMRTFQYRAPDARNFVIVRYRLANTNDSTLTGLRCGLYLDWDISTDGLDDKVDYDMGRRLGMVRDSRNSESLWAGALHLSGGESSFYAVNNFSDGVISDFTPARKWKTLASGIWTNDNVDDMGMTIGEGGITIPAGGFVEVGFALLAASSYDSLLAAADAATSYYQLSGARRTNRDVGAMLVAPNPADDRITLQATIAQRGTVVANVYSSMGTLVQTYELGLREAGSLVESLDVSRFANGLYFVRLSLPNGESHATSLCISR